MLSHGFSAVAGLLVNIHIDTEAYM